MSKLLKRYAEILKEEDGIKIYKNPTKEEHAECLAMSDNSVTITCDGSDVYEFPMSLGVGIASTNGVPTDSLVLDLYGSENAVVVYLNSKIKDVDDIKSNLGSLSKLNLSGNETIEFNTDTFKPDGVDRTLFNNLTNEGMTVGTFLSKDLSEVDNKSVEYLEAEVDDFSIMPQTVDRAYIRSVEDIAEKILEAYESATDELKATIKGIANTFKSMVDDVIEQLPANEYENEISDLEEITDAVIL